MREVPVAWGFEKMAPWGGLDRRKEGIFPWDRKDGKQVTVMVHFLEVAFDRQSEKAMAPRSSTLAWKIPWMEEPGGLHSMGSLRVRHDFTFTFTFHFHALEREMATHSSVLAWTIPGTAEPGGLPSMGSHRVRHDWNDLAAAAAVWQAVRQEASEKVFYRKTSTFLVNLKARSTVHIKEGKWGWIWVIGNGEDLELPLWELRLRFSNK